MVCAHFLLGDLAFRKNLFGMLSNLPVCFLVTGTLEPGLVGLHSRHFSCACSCVGSFKTTKQGVKFTLRCSLAVGDLLFNLAFNILEHNLEGLRERALSSWRHRFACILVELMH